MSDPKAPPLDAQLRATGLDLTDAERAGIVAAATEHLLPMLARLRRDLPVALEPAGLFVPGPRA
jgi:hypothetical protein